MMTRAELVIEARSWIPTKYHRRGMIKNVAADCGSFIGCVLVAGGLLDTDKFNARMEEIRALGDDWFFHKSASAYTDIVNECVPIAGKRMTYGMPGEPSGNVLLMQTHNSRHRNHGGIVTVWPKLIHCMYEGVEEINLLFDPMWSHEEVTVYDPWGTRGDKQ